MSENQTKKPTESKATIKSTIETLLNGMDGFISSKNVIGEPITVGDIVLVPLLDISFGVGAGAGSKANESSGCGGIGGKITPNSVLMIQGGHARLISVKKQDGFTKVMDLIPDLISRYTESKEGSKEPSNSEAVEIVFPENSNE